ncbi:hypothetical protein EV356DRAFT_521743 [Viridothelium virens]|uniref:Serine/threonine-protein kinase ppk6 n=1 Tax=Viridothelium virens TaxID=1048519 RepID=A0A6A6HGD0_VIRVR|nr:hypothetical protein EV356DRAFT_521743 [Viridothelium virens]
MSADLYAAFGQPSSDQATAQQKSDTTVPKPKTAQDVFSLDTSLRNVTLDDSTVWGQPRREPQLFSWNEPLQNANRPELRTPGIDDEWGDFENATISQPEQSSTDTAPATSMSFQNIDALEELDPWHKPLSSKISKKSSSNLARVPRLSPDPVRLQAESKPTANAQAKQPPASEVLFDADEEVDDFGDFETGAPDFPTLNTNRTYNDHGIQAQAPKIPDGYHGDLISISAEPPVVEQESSSEPTKQRLSPSRPKPDLKTAPTLQKKAAFQPLPNVATDEAWDDFDETTPPEPIPELDSAEVLTGTGDDDRALAVFAWPTPPLSRNCSLLPDDLPPTNIPPPVILLSLFPPLFSQMYTEFFQPLARQDPSRKTKILKHSKTLEYLQGCLTLAATAGRIVAGRKHRWKRDTHLSQGMRIGPAGRSGGMKLTGIDKAENNKEEREVLDVVRAWREQSGRLRSAVTAAQSASHAESLGAIPDIQETMVVKTAKQLAGGVPAPHQCALCGLKRDERVLKVDNEVQDSFGEWWIEQVSMHKNCRDFWEEQKGSIRQR